MLTSHADLVRGVAFGLDGKIVGSASNRLAAGSHNGLIKLRDGATLQLVYSPLSRDT